MTKTVDNTDDIEVIKLLNEVDKIHISKIEILVTVLEAIQPCIDQNFGEVTKYKAALDEIDSGIIINKLKELVKKL